MASLKRCLDCQRLFAAGRLGVAFTAKQAISSTIIPSQFRSFHEGTTLGPPPSARSQTQIQPGVCHTRIQHAFSAQPTNAVLFSSMATLKKEPIIHHVFEPVTCTWQYVVADPVTYQAVIIDPVLDYDPISQIITANAADFLLALVKEEGYRILHILETHAHADHLTAASYLQSRLVHQQSYKPRIGIGKRIVGVQKLFGERYGIPKEQYAAVFETLFNDDETFKIGDMKATAIHLPGHTPDHVGYKIGDNVFCGDSVFHADIGTARCDFPGGSAKHLFRSGRRLLSLPGHVKIWTGHDYPPMGRRDVVAYLTVDEHRERNKHLSDGILEEEYVTMRKARDEQMSAPRLLHQALQVNICGGHLPKQTQAGLRLLHLPLKVNCAEW